MSRVLVSSDKTSFLQRCDKTLVYQKILAKSSASLTINHSSTSLNSSMRILGIDPGFDRTGWGVIDVIKNEFRWIGHGCIQTSSKDDFTQRLQETRDGVKRIIEKAKPDLVVVEKLFFSSNAKTAINVGMGRGVILLAIADAGIPMIELTPNQIKQAAAGYGGAKKDQIQEMVKRILKLDDIPKPDDAADALAIAIAGSTMKSRE